MNTTLLARVPFLADVPADRLRADLPLLQPFSVGPDEVLIQEGEVDDALLIILEGSVQVEVGDPALVVAEARAGEILGETALFRPAWRREATLRTQTACRIIVLGGPAIAALRSAGSPTLAAIERHALQSIARRLRRVALNAPPEVLEALPDDAPPSLLSRLTSWLWGEGARAHPQQPPDVEACLAQAFPDLPPPCARRWRRTSPRSPSSRSSPSPPPRSTRPRSASSRRVRWSSGIRGAPPSSSGSWAASAPATSSTPCARSTATWGRPWPSPRPGAGR